MNRGGKEGSSLLALTAAAASLSITGYLVWKRRKAVKHVVPDELRSSPYAEHLEVALSLALQAGRNMVPYCEQRGTSQEVSLGMIETKGQPEDFCTSIDVENEALVMKGLQAKFPGHKIIGEEAVGTGTIPPLTESPTWIIDPIDGTTNFASGLPLTCVSIGFCDNGKPVAGIVYAPMTNEVYLAVEGYGSFRNGQQLAPRTHIDLDRAVVCFEFGYARDESAISKMTGAVGNILRHGCRTGRCLGSGVLDLCYVASGRMDVVYAGVANEGWKPWDYCAGYVIAKETNCAMQAIDQPETTEGFDIYSNSVICAASLNLLQQVRKTIK